MCNKLSCNGNKKSQFHAGPSMLGYLSLLERKKTWENVCLVSDLATSKSEISFIDIIDSDRNFDIETYKKECDQQTNKHTPAHTQTRTQTCTHIHTHTYTRTHTNTCTQTYTHRHTQIHTRTHTNTRTQTYTHTHTETHTHTHRATARNPIAHTRRTSPVATFQITKFSVSPCGLFHDTRYVEFGEKSTAWMKSRSYKQNSTEQQNRGCLCSRDA